MNLTLNQKAELDALVNFFGGKSLLARAWEKDRTHIALNRHGLTRWGRVRGALREHIATAKGVAVAKRFKNDWSEIWGELHPSDPE